jgi:single-stranded-DNA-specific exonuclease
MALADTMGFDADRKKHILYRYMPIVAIGTVSDCVPLVGENRLFVKKGLELINSDHHYIPSSLKSFLDHFNLRKKLVTSTDI